MEHSAFTTLSKYSMTKPHPYLRSSFYLLTTRNPSWILPYFNLKLHMQIPRQKGTRRASYKLVIITLEYYVQEAETNCPLEVFHSITDSVSLLLVLVVPKVNYCAFPHMPSFWRTVPTWVIYHWWEESFPQPRAPLSHLPFYPYVLLCQLPLKLFEPDAFKVSVLTSPAPFHLLTPTTLQ